ncbi:Protoheme IX farnesyltransferase, mitochondrial [Hypsizygus marmoreus]|uniref:Protoheme IX farnesyltransferase, mitochondrial n=1 Tax=Hypsizygus marmoreus TaxID=39966 RepID=A0A369KAU3_HYPMA|nr:Protoheme IX farnesyltransferase, mitochondrial [Hypsizygus marmoreus]
MIMQRGVLAFRQCNACLGRRIGVRSVSSLTGPAVFTSFFFHNAQWLNSRPRRLSSTTPSFLVPAPVPLSTYKEAEVLTPGRLLKVYAQLSKTRLSILVVLTAMSGVALSPLPATVPILLSTAIGTALCAASANALNQLQEIPLDAQMARTRMRPLVRRAISPLHAAGFAAVTGVAGPVLLWTMVNPTTAALGAANIVLYAGVYTWSKRRSIASTWVGAVVGGIPPVMGWTACGGALLPSAAHPIKLFLPPILSSTPLPPVDLSFIDNPLAPFALFMLLYSWQFPHFNALSYIVRGAYAQAGYPMLSVLSPSKNALVSLRHAALLVPVCSVLFPLSGLTTWTFALTGLIPNLICVRAAWRFWKKGGEKEARIVFQHSLWYLPVMLGLMMVHKQGVDWFQWLGFGPADKEEEKKKEEVDINN